MYRIKKALRDKDFIELFKEGGISFFYRFGGLILGYILTLIIANLFGARGLGDYVLAITVLRLFTLLLNIIQFFLKQKVKIKLPNDIIVNKKKLCGVLHETIFFKNSRYLIMGIGININNSPTLNNYPTTFMNEYLKKKIGINEIFRKIKNEFELYLNDNSW